jgi:predicted nucleotidyltransferase
MNDQTIYRREYMRVYQREKYNSDKNKARGYQQSLKLKKKFNINEEFWVKYKHYLADIVKLEKIMEHVPKELILEIVQQPPHILAKIELNIRHCC